MKKDKSYIILSVIISLIVLLLIGIVFIEKEIITSSKRETNNVKLEMVSGKDALKMFQDRGFDFEKIMADYDTDGNKIEKIMMSTTEEKYPEYHTAYINDCGTWNIYITGDKVSCVLNGNKRILIYEEENAFFYNKKTNSFERYKINIKKNTYIIDEINKKTLDNFKL